MRTYLWLLVFVVSNACQSQDKNSSFLKVDKPIPMNVKEGEELAILAGGCFWCTEAIFLELEGVKTVVSGYIGGTTTNPTYKDICTGTTGHAEAIQISFDPKIISYGELLELFFATHDPTTLNRQGNDVGTQYRSEIFYYTEQQKQTAIDYIELLHSEKTFPEPIVTRISPASVFYEAETYHQNYYNQNKTQAYCSYVITPKIEKVKKKYYDKLKK